MLKEFSIRENKHKTRINEQIRVPEVRVIDDHGDQRGVMSIQQALKLADSVGLDLIEVSPTSKPPVCKIANFGKFNYEKQKKEKEQKKSKTSSQVKEIRFHPNTDTHDLEFKCKHLMEFLIEGHKVKATVIFIGRMMVHQEIGKRLLNEVIEKLLIVGKIEQDPKMEGRHLTVMFIPEKKKIEQYLKTHKPQPAQAAAPLAENEEAGDEEAGGEENGGEESETK